MMHIISHIFGDIIGGKTLVVSCVFQIVRHCSRCFLQHIFQFPTKSIGWFRNSPPFSPMFSQALLPYPQRLATTRRLLQGLLGQRRAAALELHEVTEGVAVADHRGQFAQEVGHLRRSGDPGIKNVDDNIWSIWIIYV